eukprot:CAMPEP_0196573574 /NCGR_PEP_ID=MMETSP1081-20130531/3454_1 /TAXON_ID=36882 /ORGANISM="Pyramimonas amylifera, Strain CCMP720" /LENGTH=301 /DNA_ID=CAMNT_0041891329 /DNA_START=328 /DNA_END=1232 /DNA_ORIENTATION=+
MTHFLEYKLGPREVGLKCGLHTEISNILFGAYGVPNSSKIELELDVKDTDFNILTTTLHSSSQAQWERTLLPFMVPPEEGSSSGSWTLLSVQAPHGTTTPNQPFLSISQATPLDSVSQLNSTGSTNEDGHLGVAWNPTNLKPPGTIKSSLAKKQPGVKEQRSGLPGKKSPVGDAAAPASLLSVSDPQDIEAVLSMDAEFKEALSKRTPGRLRNRMYAEPPAADSSSLEEMVSAQLEDSTFALLSDLPAEPLFQDGEQILSPEGGDTRWEEMKRDLKPGQRIARDWKGDPMIINPGDNIPGL